MASLNATTSFYCQGTQGYVAITSISDAPGAPEGGEYSWEVINADTGQDYGGPTGGNNNVAVPNGTYNVRVYASYPNSTTATSTPRTYTVTCSDTPPVDPPPEPTGPMGCMMANAFNYDATATQDTTPTSCVFVIVDTPPNELVAAHLPIPVEMRAAPTLTGMASIVVLILETSSSLSGPWTEFGRLKAICNDDATVSFNLSEAAKSLLRIQPPVESGVDAALSVLLRARYEVLDPETLSVLYTGDVGTCRAVNAVIQPSSGATLTSTTTYATVPDNGQLWQSVVTYAGGVRSTLLARDNDGCRAREFVWLNAAGAWDQGFFFGRHVHGTDQADAISYRDLVGAERYASKGTVRETLQVYSDISDWPTYKLLRGLRQSIQVYERLGPGSYVPVLVNADSFPEYTEQTDKTFQVNFTVSYPAQQIQTQ
jgi:hypothetical protein